MTKWLNDDRGEESTTTSGHHGDRCIRREARRQSRDDATASSGMSAALQSGGWIEGSTTTSESHSSTRQWRRRYTFACHAESFSRGLWICCGELCTLASSLWQKAAHRALKELEFVHLVVVPCTYFHVAWDMSLTYHGDDLLSESEPEYQDMLDMAPCPAMMATSGRRFLSSSWN